MTRYPVLLVAVLLVFLMQGRLQAQSSADDTVAETGQRTPLEAGRTIFDQEKFIETVAPAGEVYQAGTLSGNPLAMIAGYETVRQLQEPGVYERLEDLASRLGDGLRAAAAEAGVPAYLTRVGSMMCTFFTDRTVTDFDSASTSDADTYGRYFWNMLDRGVYLAPSRLETGFVSLAHTEGDIDRTLEAARESMNALSA